MRNPHNFLSMLMDTGITARKRNVFSRKGYIALISINEPPLEKTKLNYDKLKEFPFEFFKKSVHLTVILVSF